MHFISEEKLLMLIKNKKLTQKARRVVHVLRCMMCSSRCTYCLTKQIMLLFIHVKSSVIGNVYIGIPINNIGKSNHAMCSILQLFRKRFANMAITHSNYRCCTHSHEGLYSNNIYTEIYTLHYHIITSQ